MNKLSELFNVNHFIVCQVNPHVIPFLQKSNTPSTLRQATNFCMHLAKTEIQHRCTQVTGPIKPNRPLISFFSSPKSAWCPPFSTRSNPSFPKNTLATSPSYPTWAILISSGSFRIRPRNRLRTRSSGVNGRRGRVSVSLENKVLTEINRDVDHQESFTDWARHRSDPLSSASAPSERTPEHQTTHTTYTRVQIGLASEHHHLQKARRGAGRKGKWDDDRDRIPEYADRVQPGLTKKRKKFNQARVDDDKEINYLSKHSLSGKIRLNSGARDESGGPGQTGLLFVSVVCFLLVIPIKKMSRRSHRIAWVTLIWLKVSFNTLPLFSLCPCWAALGTRVASSDRIWLILSRLRRSTWLWFSRLFLIRSIAVWLSTFFL